MSGTSGGVNSVGTSGGYDASHGRASYDMVGKSGTAYGAAETVTVGCGVGCWSTVMSWNGSRRSA